ncbi:MAG TPA: sulfotransferase [Burkholderiaceae bacterium]
MQRNRTHTPPRQSISVGEALKQAVARHRAGELAEAEKLYRLILQAIPDQPDANHNLGLLIRQNGKPTEALPYFETAIRNQPAIEAYTHSYAETLLACERPEDAMAALEAARRRGLDSASLQQLLAHARKLAGGIASLRGIFSDAERSRISDLVREERFAELEPMVEQRLAQLPDAGQLWKFYAVVLGQLGKDALRAHQRAIALLPDDSTARFNLARYFANAGAASYESGKLVDAIACYSKAVELEPQQFDVLNNLGNALKDLGRLDEAEKSYRAAIAANPECAEAWCNLSLLYKAMGRHDESEEACNKSRALDPNYVGALIQAGDLAIDRGRFAEAEQLFRQGMAADPKSAEAWAGVSRTRKMTLKDEEWARGAAALADSGLTPAMEAYLRFALGKYFDDTRQFDSAFPQFQRANALNLLAAQHVGHAVYDDAAFGRNVDSIIAHFNAATIRQPRFAHPSARPVLILGLPRSGTSLAEQILASHPEVYGGGELGLWANAAAQYRAALQPGREPGAALPDIAVNILRRLHAIDPHAKRVVDKMPGNFFHIGLIHAAFPNARIIHMRRNPVDVCLSIYFNSFAETQHYASDLHHLAHYYRQYEKLMAHWRSVLPENAMLDVPYEALVQDQESWSRKMIEFIGLPWDERCLNFHEHERAVHTPSNWQVRQKIGTGSVERWRNYEKFIGPLAGLLDLAA